MSRNNKKNEFWLGTLKVSTQEIPFSKIPSFGIDLSYLVS